MPYLEQVKIRHFRNYYTELYQKTFIVTYRFGFRWISVSSVSRLATASSRCLYRALSFISMPSVEFLLFRFSLSAFRFSIVALALATVCCNGISFNSSDTSLILADVVLRFDVMPSTLVIMLGT